MLSRSGKTDAKKYRMGLGRKKTRELPRFSEFSPTENEAAYRTEKKARFTRNFGQNAYKPGMGFTGGDTRKGRPQGEKEKYTVGPQGLFKHYLRKRGLVRRNNPQHLACSLASREVFSPQGVSTLQAG